MPYYHSAVYILLDRRKYSEKSENVKGLDSYTLNRYVLF